MKVAIVMGSDSDWQVMQGAYRQLKELGVETTMEVMSAHRTPARAAAFASAAREEGYGCIIAGAGMAAHLAGVMAAHTTLPVIGVPLKGGVGDGMDALLATVQMPPGVPVATVGVGGAKNAAILAAQMLALQDERLAKMLADYKTEMAEAVGKKNAAMQGEL